MKPINILILMIAVLFVAAACEKNPLETTDVFAESFDGLDKAATATGGPGQGQGRIPPPVFLLDGPGPFFLWALDLTQEQQEQLQVIGEKYWPQQGPQGGMQGGSHQGGPGQPPDENVQAQHEERMQAMREEMMAVLTEAQTAILTQIEAQLQNGQYPDLAVEKKVNFLTEKLSLDSGQQSEMADIIKEYGDRWVALRFSGDPREAHEAIRTLFEELDEAVTEILTQDQLDAYESLKEDYKSQGPGPGGPHGPPGGPQN